MPIDLFYIEARKRIEETLAELVEERGSPLLDAARYSLLAPAKRLRPLLMLATAVSYGAKLEWGLVPSCALEVIHTYSLIHDDLPCMDDDDLRRGKPTLHKIVPEWHALLTGDYLLTYAFELLSGAKEIEDAQKIALINLFSTEAGADGMIGGQMIDLLSENQTIEWPLLEEMHTKKTASLIIVALVGGAILGKAPVKDLELLKVIGQKIGVAFQLVDDLLDVIGTTEELGKRVGSDVKQHKSTAISILGIENTREKIDELNREVNALCQQLSCSSDLLKEIFQHMIKRYN